MGIWPNCCPTLTWTTLTLALWGFIYQAASRDKNTESQRSVFFPRSFGHVSWLKATSALGVKPLFSAPVCVFGVEWLYTVPIPMLTFCQSLSPLVLHFLLPFQKISTKTKCDRAKQWESAVPHFKQAVLRKPCRRPLWHTVRSLLWLHVGTFWLNPLKQPPSEHVSSYSSNPASNQFTVEPSPTK